MTKVKLVYFFLKTGDEASKVLTNSFKNLDFATPISFDTFFWQQWCNI